MVFMRLREKWYEMLFAGRNFVFFVAKWFVGRMQLFHRGIVSKKTTLTDWFAKAFDVIRVHQSLLTASRAFSNKIAQKETKETKIPHLLPPTHPAGSR
jgi:hypothetical protein